MQVFGHLIKINYLKSVWIERSFLRLEDQIYVKILRTFKDLDWTLLKDQARRKITLRLNMKDEIWNWMTKLMLKV